MAGRLDRIRRIYRTAEKPLGRLWRWAKAPKSPKGRARRFEALGRWAKKKARQAEGEARAAWNARRRIYRKRYRHAKNRPDQHVPGIVDGGWHPGAERNQVLSGIGTYLDVPPKLVWHTTEGFGLPTYSGSHPHFTLDPKTGKLWQHISIRSGAMALRNLRGSVETNRAHAIQVELIGFARQTPGWSDAAYANIAKLARWIEKHAGVKRASSVRFGGAGNLPPRLSGSAWYGYAGHLGHQHVPEQDHWDPGQLVISRVLG